MEELKINTNLEVGKLAALNQSKIVNSTDEEKKPTVKGKKEEERKEDKTDENKNVAVDRLVEMANQFIQRFSTKISFYYDPQRNVSKILVTEKETGKVIREIPPEQMVDLMQKMDEIAGIIYNGRA